MVKVSEIAGIGPAKAAILESKGYTTAEKISIMPPEELKAIMNISVAGAKKIINAAKDTTRGAVKLLSGTELQIERDKIQYVSTGSDSLDKLFLYEKGIPTDAITGFYGQFASGKSQLCNQIAVNMKQQHNRKTVWVETEPQTLVLDRLLQIAKAHKVEYNLADDLIIIPAKYMETPTHQFKAYEGIEEKIKSGVDIGLIVIDSFNALFRSSYIGRETLPLRSAEQGRHIGYLQKIASKYNVAVVMTLQVMGVPDGGSQLGCIKKYGIREPPVASHVLKHGINYMVGLDQISSKDRTWKAIIADGPVPRSETVFVIDETGISEFCKRRG